MDVWCGDHLEFLTIKNDIFEGLNLHHIMHDVNILFSPISRDRDVSCDREIEV